jgi:hypothetical protein
LFKLGCTKTVLIISQKTAILQEQLKYLPVDIITEARKEKFTEQVHSGGVK